MKCKTHKQYKGINRPIVICDDCWKVYFENHPTNDWNELLKSLKHFSNTVLKKYYPELSSLKYRRGQLVKLNRDIKDSYGETYLSNGETVQIKKVIPEQKGYEYELPYGFCVGEESIKLVQ
jgi:hypothetical protein